MISSETIVFVNGLQTAKPAIRAFLAKQLLKFSSQNRSALKAYQRQIQEIFAQEQDPSVIPLFKKLVNQIVQE